MALRSIFMLLCIVVFINGCNNLVSQHFGTHKLRTYSLDEIGEAGIGDADFIAISDAQIAGDFIFAPGRGGSEKAVVLYPLVEGSQLDSLQKGQSVKIHFLGWEKRRQISDVDTLKMLQAEPIYSGLVREPASRYKKDVNLNPAKYELADTVNYLQVGTEPLAWYWNATALIFSLSIFLFLGSKLK